MTLKTTSFSDETPAHKSLELEVRIPAKGNITLRIKTEAGIQYVELSRIDALGLAYELNKAALE